MSQACAFPSPFRWILSEMGDVSQLALPIRTSASCHPLVQNGRQVRAGGFVVETDGHQCHWLDNSKPAFKTPAEQGRVSGRHQNSRTLEFGGCRNQRLQVLIAVGDR